MNCDYFHQRMQTRLDDRLALNADPDLVQHANGCGSCRAKLNVWLSIESVIASPTMLAKEQKSTARHLSVYTFASIAASVLLVLSFTADNRSGTADQQTVASVVSETSEPVDIKTTFQAAEWWATVSPEDWFAQTMPAVRSVQEGVAPLGRSLLQAVTILTVGDPGQTS